MVVGVMPEVIMGRENHAVGVGNGSVKVNDRVTLRQRCRNKIIDIVDAAHRGARGWCGGTWYRYRSGHWFGNAVVKPPVVIRCDESISESEEAIVKSATGLVFRAWRPMQKLVVVNWCLRVCSNGGGEGELDAWAEVLDLVELRVGEFPLVNELLERALSKLIPPGTACESRGASPNEWDQSAYKSSFPETRGNGGY
jgi:hypothetical protein